MICNPIDENTDISHMEYVDWDLVINDTKYNVYRIDGYPHTIGGKWGENCYYCCESDDSPIYENLIALRDENVVTWGYTIREVHRWRNKWDEVSVVGRGEGVIYRNDRVFYEIDGTIEYLSHYIPHLLTVIHEQLPFNVFSKNFRKEILGRKIGYKGSIYKVTEYIDGQCCIMIDRPHDDEDETKIDIIQSLNIVDWYPEG